MTEEDKRRTRDRGTYTCDYCGEFVFNNTYKGLCRKCSSVHTRFNEVPKPEDKGSLVCPYDGGDYKIHECEWRKALAKRRKAEGKPYQMPQCGGCPLIDDAPLPIRTPDSESC